MGAGGFGSVYRAFDFELERDCAMKFFSAKGASEDEIKRFYREAKLTAKLEHPDIVKVFDFGKEGDALYCAMEIVRGVSLDRILEEGCINPEIAVKIARDCALALHHAHLKGIIHRDIKPHNIMIVPLSVYENPDSLTDARSLASNIKVDNFRTVLLDFGLARFLRDRSSTFMMGEIAGTPLYMAPEMTEGTLAKLVPTLDIYSLGVVLYETVNGKLPFHAKSFNELSKKVHEENPEPISDKVLAARPDIAFIIEKAMAKKPERRYQTALEFANDCEKFLRGEPLRPGAQNITFRTRVMIRRSSRLIIPILAVAFAFALYFTASNFVEKSKRDRLISDAQSLLSDDPEEAEELFRRALVSSPDDHAAADGLAASKRKLKQKQMLECLRNARQLVATEPSRAKAFVETAAAISLGDFEPLSGIQRADTAARLSDIKIHIDEKKFAEAAAELDDLIQRK